MKNDNAEWKPGDSAWIVLMENVIKAKIRRVEYEDDGDGAKATWLKISGDEHTGVIVHAKNAKKSYEEALVRLYELRIAKSKASIENHEKLIAAIRKDMAKPAKPAKRAKRELTAAAKAKRAAYMRAYWKKYKKKHKQ